MELAHGLAHEIRQNRPVSVTVDVELEAKIAEAVAARRPMIADLVRQASPGARRPRRRGARRRAAARRLHGSLVAQCLASRPFSAGVAATLAAPTLTSFP